MNPTRPSGRISRLPACTSAWNVSAPEQGAQPHVQRVDQHRLRVALWPSSGWPRGRSAARRAVAPSPSPSPSSTACTDPGRSPRPAARSSPGTGQSAARAGPPAGSPPPAAWTSGCLPTMSASDARDTSGDRDLQRPGLAMYRKLRSLVSVSVDTRLEHLDHDLLAAAPQHRRVHLRDGSRRQRCSDPPTFEHVLQGHRQAPFPRCHG